ncbi:MAG: hypothetical protein FJ087_21340 [Deltaproteobacteria bacterium]|nr:hypothetical protein [Deltaproteobacteria bacterium]
MSDRGRGTAAALAIALALAGCSCASGGSDPSADAADAPSDAQPFADAPEAPGDAAEAPGDAAPEAVADAAPEAGTDAAPEAGTDAAPEAGTDAAFDIEAADAPGLPHPTGCCDAPADCPQGSVCLGLHLGTPGTCWTAPEKGKCFFDSDCGEGEKCLGDRHTICVMSSLPSEGDCVKGPADCCRTDQDCDLGTGMAYVCTGEGTGHWSPGLCMPLPPAGQCWTGTQCEPGWFCHGAVGCGCLVDCAGMKPGECLPLPGDCCKADGDCDPGYACARFPGSDTGVCEIAAPPGKCWDDADCESWQACDGEKVCPCNADCDEPDHMGSCQALPGCCFADAQCSGLVCGGATPGGAPGSCLPQPAAGRCWDGPDCAPGEVCEGAAICPCEAACDMEDTPGTCTQAGCCALDTECGEGMACVHPELGGTCEPKPEAGKCWKDSDCYSTQECAGGSPCPCGMLCAEPSWPGTCTPLPAGCCNADSDCGPGLVCRGGLETDHLPGSCVPDPLGPQCPGDAACCWDDADCPGISACKGALVCGCIELCWACGMCAPDQMGTCG